MLATVKIIPFAAPRRTVEAAERVLGGEPVVRVAPFAAEARGADLDRLAEHQFRACSTRIGRRWTRA